VTARHYVEISLRHDTIDNLAPHDMVEIQGAAIGPFSVGPAMNLRYHT
jgi:hypothetical protein